MSRYIATRAARGANALVAEAEVMLAKTIAERGAATPVAFPNTAYYLPVALGMLGHEVKTLGDLRPVVEHANKLLHPAPDENLWVPYLGETLDSGMATLLAAETIEGVRFVLGQQPESYPGFHLAGGTSFTSPEFEAENGGGHLNGPIDDIQLRSWGIQLVDGRMPGFAAIVGAARSNKAAVAIVRELQRRNILTFLSGNVNGRSIIDQLREEGVEMGYDTFIVPFGRDTISAIYALGFATRSALTFGGLKGGQWRGHSALQQVPCLRLRPGPRRGRRPEVRRRRRRDLLRLPDHRRYRHPADSAHRRHPLRACHLHALERDRRGNGRREGCQAGAAGHRGARRQDQDDRSAHPGAVRLCLRGRGGAQEGHARRVRRQVQPGLRVSAHGGHGRGRGRQDRGRSVRAIESMPAGGAMDMGIVIEVAGRKMQTDFEPVLERQIHYFVNGASGIQHIGQRDIAWIRISQAAVRQGLQPAPLRRHPARPLPRRLRRDRGQGAGQDLSPIRPWSPSGWTRPATAYDYPQPPPGRT